MLQRSGFKVQSLKTIKPEIHFRFLLSPLPVCGKVKGMKSSFELAMERLNKTAPAVKLTAKQKQELAELDNRYAAKIAEREIALKGEIEKAGRDAQIKSALLEQLADERNKLRAELEEKKEQVRKDRD
jgi:hypothetical protein